MSDDGLYSIGQLAERTGLSVRTIRFCSDEGVVPATGRSVAGYRRYDIDALARLDLVRTLRDIGLPLPTVRAVLDNGLSLPQVAAAHARALDTQIGALRLRRAVLRAVAKRTTTPPPLRRHSSCTSSRRCPTSNEHGSSRTSSTTPSAAWTPTPSSSR